MKLFKQVIISLVFLFCMQGSYASTVACTTAAESDFVPSFGQVYVGEDQASRFIYQWIMWDNYTRLSWLISNGDSTFEPDAFFYNYGDPVGGSAYGTAPLPYGFWDSNLPAAYIDTQAFDSNSEKAVTIGSAQAASIVPQQVYFTVTRMVSGSVPTGWLKLSAQRGRRVPSACNTTWCSFGCEGINNVRTMPFNATIQPTNRKFSAPSCARYWYNWQYAPSPFFYDC